jgi:hypothetical protein
MFRLQTPRGGIAIVECAWIVESRGQPVHFRTEVDEACCVCGQTDNHWTDREETFDNSPRRCGQRSRALPR